jgi:hypothetical protein
MTNMMTDLEARSPGAPWIEIHDDVVTSEELVAEVEQRVARRRAELGPVNLVFPVFGHVSTFPEPPPAGQVSPHLYYYLKQANQTPAAAVEPLLASSPATQLPVIGRFWQRVRGQVHSLVLFYLNRAVRDQNRLNVNLISTLNELTRVVQEQATEIDALRTELRRRD